MEPEICIHTIQTLNSSIPSKTSPPQPPQTAINWKLAAAPAAATCSVYYPYSLLHYHPNPNPNLHFVRHKHSVPLPDGVRDPAPRSPPNVFFLNVAPQYDDALKQVEDESLSAVFYFTERSGPGFENQKCLLKDVGDSKAQLQLEEKTEQEKYNFGHCRVCCKENEHFSSACPYWNGVPPGAIVGDGYGVVCGLFDRRLYKNPNRCAHPSGSSKGRLIVAYCNYCKDKGLHWSEKCPERPKDKPYKPLFISSSKPKLLKKIY